MHSDAAAAMLARSRSTRQMRTAAALWWGVLASSLLRCTPAPCCTHARTPRCWDVGVGFPAQSFLNDPGRVLLALDCLFPLR